MDFNPDIAAIRLGYGLSARVPPPQTADAFLRSVALSVPDDHAVGMDHVRAEQTMLSDLNSLRKKDPEAASVKEIRQQQRQMRIQSAEAIRHRFARAAGDPGGFGERLVQFWADHFTVSGGSPYQDLMAAAFVDEAIRPHLQGSFAQLMFAAETHPRMVTYLDQDRSFGPHSWIARRRKGRDLGLNENLAREMIELHSLGAGAPYTQKDVRQLAKLLTGLSFHLRRDGNFRPVMAEPGAETVLGQRYGGDRPASLDDIREVIVDLAAHPSTSRHLARKLAVHFVADDPPQSLVDRLDATYRETGGDLPSLYAALMDGPELWSHFRQKVRQPFDFLVAALRALGLDQQRVLDLPMRQVNARLIRPLTNMGQEWAMPRGPDGWPEAAESWATPQGIALRIDWAMRQPRVLVPKLPDPRDFLQAALGETASEALKWAVPRAESAREGLMIVLASADFNRR